MDDQLLHKFARVKGWILAILLASAGLGLAGCYATNKVQGASPTPENDLDAALGAKQSIRIDLLADLQNQRGIQVIQRGDQLRFIIYTDTCFQTGSNNMIDSSCFTRLNNVAGILKTYKEFIIITAYTDNVYSPSDAKYVTQQQANAILTYMWTHGVSSYQMQAYGLGGQDAMASNYMPRGSQFNRRIEIFVKEHDPDYVAPVHGYKRIPQCDNQRFVSPNVC